MKVNQKVAVSYIRAKLKLLSLVSKRKTAEKIFELFCTPLATPAGKPPSIFASAEELSFTLNGSKVQGYRWNKGQSNKVLILHGFGSAAYNFHYYVAAMAEKGYEVFAFNAPAHGNSEGNTINAVQYGEMIERIIDLYGPVNGFLGHSLGGLALSLALENTVHSKNTRIVFIAPATETSSAVDGAFKFLQIGDKAVRQEFDNIILERSGHSTAWFSMKRAIKNITANILWIHDEDDDVTPLKDALLVKAEGYPNIDFVITKGLGHRRIYRDSAVQNKVAQFL